MPNEQLALVSIAQCEDRPGDDDLYLRRLRSAGNEIRERIEWMEAVPTEPVTAVLPCVPEVRGAKRISFGGEALTLREWSERVGVSLNTIEKRIRDLRWPVEDAIFGRLGDSVDEDGFDPVFEGRIHRIKSRPPSRSSDPRELPFSALPLCDRYLPKTVATRRLSPSARSAPKLTRCSVASVPFQTRQPPPRAPKVTGELKERRVHIRRTLGSLPPGKAHTDEFRALVIGYLLDRHDVPLALLASDLSMGLRLMYQWLDWFDVSLDHWPLDMRDSEHTKITNAPWDEDPVCLRVLYEHPDGATPTEIGDAYGVSPQAVDNITRRALCRMGPRVRFADDAIEWFSRRPTGVSAWEDCEPA
jgi:hypothetical protein